MNSDLSPLSASLWNLVTVDESLERIKKSETPKGVLNDDSIHSEKTNSIADKVFIGIRKNQELFVEEKNVGFFSKIARAFKSIFKVKNYEGNKSFNALKTHFNNVKRASDGELENSLQELHKKGLLTNVRDAKAVRENLDPFRNKIHTITQYISQKEFENHPGFVKYYGIEETWRDEKNKATLRTLDLTLIGNTPAERFDSLILRYNDNDYEILLQAIGQSKPSDCLELLDKIAGENLQAADLINNFDLGSKMNIFSTREKDLVFLNLLNKAKLTLKRSS